jgi:cbb3-type cytochrome oxidase maturation protein
MESVFLLIPISIILVFIIGGFFWWSSKNGQFDDLEGPAHRILLDDDSPQVTDNPKQETDAPTKSHSSTTTH